MAHKRFQPVGCVGGHGVRQCCRSCAISTPYNIAGREQAFDHDVNKQVRKSGGRQIVVDEVGDSAKVLLKGWGFRFPRSFRWRKEETVQICGVGLGDGKEPGSGAGTQDRGSIAATIAGVAYLPGLSTGPCPSSPGGTCQEFREALYLFETVLNNYHHQGKIANAIHAPSHANTMEVISNGLHRDKTLTDSNCCVPAN